MKILDELESKVDSKTLAYEQTLVDMKVTLAKLKTMLFICKHSA